MAFSSPPCAQQPAVPTVSETLRWLTGSRAYGLALSDSDELGDMILALKPLVLTTLPVNGLEGYAAGQTAMARRRPDQAGKRLMHAIRVTRLTRVYRETGRLIIDCRPQRGRYLAVRQGDLDLGWRWYAREKERLDDARTILPDHNPDALADAVRPILRMALDRALSDRPT